MKLFILIACFLVGLSSCKHFRLGRGKGGNLGAPGDCHDDDLPPAQWFTQNLDHFSRTDLRTWKQRFFVNDTFYKKSSGPVFLMIGGEGPANPMWMVKGTWMDYAKTYGALCVMLEHRFYGESHPTSDMSVKNLAYLSSEQALADLANFISHMNDNLPAGTKWIVFGGSYPGSLAAWMRLKYPHLVHGAVSSSGPLLAKLDFDQYFKVVVDALKQKTGSDDCVDQVKEAHRQIVHLMATNQSNVVETKFRVCKPFSEASNDDIKNFFSCIADDFAGVVQYNEDNRISQDKRAQDITINTICDLLTKSSSEVAFEKLAKFNSLILDVSNQTCLDYSYKNLINDLRNSSWSAGGGRPWTYQTCTEFGFYQTSSAEQSVFGNFFPVEFFIKQCEDIFGKKFNKKFISDGIRWSNSNYGALNVTASNIAFVHGSVDPWHALGVTDATIATDDVAVIYISGTAHCANMYPSRDSDPAELQEARVKVSQFIGRWLRS